MAFQAEFESSGVDPGQGMIGLAPGQHAPPSAKTIAPGDFLAMGLTALFFSVIVNYNFYSG